MPDSFFARFALFIGLFIVLSALMALSAVGSALVGNWLQSLWGHPVPQFFPYMMIVLFITALGLVMAALENLE